MALSLAGRALSGNVEPGRFVAPLDGVALFVDRVGDDGRLEGVFVADERAGRRPVQAAARAGRVAVDVAGTALEVRLEEGGAFFTGADDAGGGEPLALGFERFDLRVPLGGELSRRLDFLPALLAVPTRELRGPAPDGTDARAWKYALWRRVAGPVGFLAVALSTVALAFGLSWRRRGVAVGAAAALFLGYHLLSRLGETLLGAGFLGAPAAALMPSGVTLLLVAGLLLRGARQGAGNAIVRGVQKR
jgi:lipopolysaccharide export system permease protein